MDGYTKIRLLGEGAYGRVYLTREKRPPRRLVCVKQLLHHAPSSSSASSASEEIRLMKRVRHPNVVRYFDAFASTHQRWIVMEFCSGGDVRGFLKQTPPPKIHEDRVWYWTMQLCLALSYLHSGSSPQRGIWHRDVKTSNIFLNDAGFLVLGDLGVARESSVDLASTIVGTPLYMAPEIWDSKPYDGACDLWALGCVLYEVCMGRTPFEDAKSTPALIRKVCDGKYTPLPTGKWSPRLRMLVHQLLSVDPAKRPTAASILRDAENLVHIKRYLQDRADAAERVRKTEQEEEEQMILRKQLAVLGVVATVDATNVVGMPPVHGIPPSQPGIAAVDVAKASSAEAEQRLRAQRDLERQEQLRAALQRVQELRNQQQHDQQQRIEALQPRSGDNGGSKSKAKEKPSRVVATTDAADWKAPVQADIRKRPQSSRQRVASVVCKATEFAGIPRQGVPLTPQAKAFAGKTQSPLCRDVRVLRKQEFAKSAARYKATLDKQFNSMDCDNSHALQPQSEKNKKKHAKDSGDEDDNGAIAECIEQLEEVLRVQLRLS